MEQVSREKLVNSQLILEELLSKQIMRKEADPKISLIQIIEKLLETLK